MAYWSCTVPKFATIFQPATILRRLQLSRWNQLYSTQNCLEIQNIYNTPQKSTIFGRKFPKNSKIPKSLTLKNAHFAKLHQISVRRPSCYHKHVLSLPKTQLLKKKNFQKKLPLICKNRFFSRENLGKNVNFYFFLAFNQSFERKFYADSKSERIFEKYAS